MDLIGSSVKYRRRLVRVLAWTGAVIVVAAIIGALFGKRLQPWHSARLNEEFTAAKADEVRTFDDYLRLEQRLFDELAREVYMRVDTGLAQELTRYSTGSASGPTGRNPNWNRSFELAADDPVGGVLLLHGMSDSPYSMRAVGELLNGQGYHVVGLRLPGHGTTPSALRFVAAEDMSAAVHLSMRHLSSLLGEKPIHIIGYSTGAALGLEFALDAAEGKAAPEPASLVLLSPAIRVAAAAALASFQDWLSVVPGLGGMAWLDNMAEFDPYKYNSFATNAGDVVYRITTTVDKRIAARAGDDTQPSLPPILVFKSAVDATVTIEAVVDRLLKNLSSRRHEIVLFDINRFAARSMIMIDDPGPITDRLMADDSLPFTVTFVTNEDARSPAVVLRRKPPFTGQPESGDPLGLQWPLGVISLSHVAVPFPPDDPLYGAKPPENRDDIFLGSLAVRGERGLLTIPENYFLRLRYNPFFEYMSERIVQWVSVADASRGGKTHLEQAQVD